LADGAYDSNNVFGCLTPDNEILPCVKEERMPKSTRKPITSLEIYQSYISEEKQFTKMVER
jgi:hypothetical protein